MFETYVFKEDGIGEQFIQALEQAAQRGVTVRIIVDPIGSVLRRASEQRLTNAGVGLSWFNPLRFWTLEETNYRTHRKVMVVDGAVAFTGGMGIADRSAASAKK